MVWNRDVNVPVEDDGLKSKINAAGLINSTLENLWKDCYTAMSNGKYLLWSTKLDAVWAILGGDVEEGSEPDKNFNAICLNIYEQGSLKTKSGSGFDKQKNPNLAVLYHLLLKKSLFLRRLQNSQGKGTAYNDGDDSDWE